MPVPLPLTDAKFDQDVTPLAYLGWVLESSGYATQLVGGAEIPGHPYERLWIHDGTTATGKERVIQILLIDDVINAAEDKPDSFDDEGSLLQFTCYLWPAPVSRVAEVEQLLLVLNRQLPFASFGFNEVEGVFLRYHLVVDVDALEPRLVAATVESLGTIAERFDPVWADLQAGKPLAVIAKPFLRSTP